MKKLFTIVVSVIICFSLLGVKSVSAAENPTDVPEILSYLPVFDNLEFKF